MTDWLIDKSALWKLAQSPDYGTWVDRINRGRVWVGLSTVLEVAVASRDAADWPRLRRELLAPLLTLDATPRSAAIAVEIMGALIAARLHRAVPLPDVMIASLAAAHRLTVCTTTRISIASTTPTTHLPSNASGGEGASSHRPRVSIAVRSARSPSGGDGSSCCPRACAQAVSPWAGC